MAVDLFPEVFLFGRNPVDFGKPVIINGFPGEDKRFDKNGKQADKISGKCFSYI